MTKKEPCKSLHPERVEGWGPVRRSSDDVVRVADQVGQGGEIAAQVPPRDQLSLCLVGKIREVDDVLGDQHVDQVFGDARHLDIGFEQPFPRSEEHTSELQSLMRISYAVFCLKKKKTRKQRKTKI